MIFIPFPIQKQAKNRSKTPSLLDIPLRGRRSFIQKAHNIRFPKVSLEGELFKTYEAENSPSLTPSQSPSPSPSRHKHIFRAIKIAKTLPTVNIVESFDYREKSRYNNAIGFKHPISSPERNLSLDSSKYSKFKTSIKNNSCKQRLFKVFSLAPKRIIAHLQASQQYVRKNSPTREKVAMLSVNYSPTRGPSFIKTITTGVDRKSQVFNK